VVPRASGQVNEIIAFVKLNIGAFEIANWLDDKRGVSGSTHVVFVTLKRQKHDFNFFTHVGTVNEKIYMISNKKRALP
jgi:hypothetical protein